MKEKYGLEENQRFKLEMPRVWCFVPSVHSRTQRAEFAVCALAFPRSAATTPGEGYTARALWNGQQAWTTPSSAPCPTELPAPVPAVPTTSVLGNADGAVQRCSAPQQAQRPFQRPQGAQPGDAGRGCAAFFSSAFSPAGTYRHLTEKTSNYFF